MSTVHAFSPAGIVRRLIEDGVLVPIAFFAVLFGVYAARTPGALDPAQLRYTLFNASVALVLVAAGLAIVVMVGGLDLSSGGVVAAVNALLTVHYAGGPGPQLFWIGVAIVASAAFGALNGLIVHRFDLEPVVVTLATGFVLTGTALLILPEPAGLQPANGTSIIALLTGTVAGVPASLIVIAGVVAGWVVLRRSRLGTWIFALGGEQESAAYTGVPVGRTRVLAFALAGALYGVAGVMVTSLTSGGDAKLGASYLLASFAAVVVGGVRLGGGAGSVIAVVFGAMAISISDGVLLSLGFDTYWSTIARGVLLLLAIGAQTLLLNAVVRRSRRTPSLEIGSSA